MGVASCPENFSWEVSKGYAELPEFSPALGLIIFGGEVCRYKLIVRSITFFLIYDKYLYVYTRTPTRLHYPARLRARVTTWLI